MPPMPISMSSGCGPKTSRSVLSALITREGKRFVRGLDLVEVVAQQNPAREIRAGHAVAGIPKREEMMGKIAMRAEVWQAVAAARVRRFPSIRRLDPRDL